MHYEVNTLAPYLLATNLQPALQRFPKSFIINTATGGMHVRKSIDMTVLKTPIKFKKLFGSYMESKFAMIVLMNTLAEQMPNTLVASVNPGANKTKMTVGDAMPLLLKPIRSLFFSEALVGATRLHDAAFREELRSMGGVYVDGSKVKALKFSLDTSSKVELLAGTQGQGLQ